MGVGSSKTPLDPPLMVNNSVWMPTQWSSLKILAHTVVIFLHSETNMLLTISLGWQIQDVSQYWCM